MIPGAAPANLRMQPPGRGRRPVPEPAPPGVIQQDSPTSPRPAADAGSSGRLLHLFGPVPTSLQPPSVRPAAEPDGGPPAPPAWIEGWGGDGSGWPRWQLMLVLGIVVAVGLGLCRVLWWGGQRFPFSVAAGLLILAFYWIRGRPLQQPGPAPPPRMLVAAGLAGAVAFLGSHVTPREVSWPALLVGSIGLGGAAGYMSWLLGQLLVLAAIAAWWLLRELLRPPGWHDAA